MIPCYNRIRSLARRFAPAVRVFLFVLAMLLPPALWYLNSPVGVNFVNPAFTYQDVRVVGPLLASLLHAITALYSWPLMVGSADPGVVFLGLYLFLAALFASWRRYREAMWLLIGPLLGSWLFFLLIRT